MNPSNIDFNPAEASTYFDAAATTPLHPAVREEMMENFAMFGNENSRHARGFETRKKFDAYVAKIADILKVPPSQLAVTYSGTDSNRRIIWECRKRFGHENLYASVVEHSSITDEILEKNLFDPCDFSILPSDPKFIALMAANSETGAIYEAGELRKRFPNAIILRDYAQVVGKGVELDFENCDAGTFAPQKIYGPKMIGLIYLKNPEHFPEISKDTHTKNLFLVAGMAKAFELLNDETPKKLTRWTQQIERFIETNIPDYKIHEKENLRVPGIINVAFRGIRGAELMAVLSEKENICVSTGSACTSDILTPTQVILFIEKDPAWQYPVRISLHQFLTDESVTDFCEILAHYVEELRKRNF